MIINEKNRHCKALLASLLVHLTFLMFFFKPIFAQSSEDEFLRERQREIKRQGLEIDERSLRNWLIQEKLDRKYLKLDFLTQDFIEKAFSSESSSHKRVFIPPKLAKSNILRSKEDFQVNEEDYPASFSQDYPDVSTFPDGSFVVVWQDDRNGDTDIYLQRYDSSGQPRGANIKVNDDATGADQRRPAVSSSIGFFVVVWSDNRNGNSDIYFQRYNSSAQPQSHNVKVTEDFTEDLYHCSPDVCSSSDGSFIVVWEKGYSYYPSDDDIYLQRYNSTGQAMGNNVKVNDDINGKDQHYPVVSYCSDSSFIVVWEDNRNGNSDIYLQLYNSSGQIRGSNIKVNDDTTGSVCYYPDVTSISDRTYVVVWEEEYNGNSDIYLQRYSNSNQTIGGNVRVNNHFGTHHDPAISSTSDGSFVVVWETNPTGDFDIYLQCYGGLGQALGSNMKVNDNFDNNYDPAISSASNGSFIVVWQYRRTNNDYDIYLQRYSSSSVPQGINVKVNDDSTGTFQFYPSISSVVDSSFVVVWSDYRNGENYDIFFQLYENSGKLQGINEKVNDDVTDSKHICPSVASTFNGSFLVVWLDAREGNWDIYLQHYSSSGEVLGNNAKVNDDVGDAVQYSPTVASASSGSFIVVWKDYRNGNSDIYFQRYNSSCQMIGNNVKVNDDFSDEYQCSPAVSSGFDGSFVVVWEDHRNRTNEIYLQRYNSSGEAQGSNIAVGDYYFDNGALPAISFASDGSFVVVWEDRRNGNKDIYLQLYDYLGLDKGNNMKVNDDNTGTSQCKPIVSSAADGSFVVIWEDYRNGSTNADIYVQKYAADGTPIGSNFRVNNDQTLKHQRNPDVTINGNNEMLFVWEDSRIPGHGYDIFAKIIDFDTTNAPPKSPILLEPANETITNDTLLSFSWNVTSDADGDNLHFKVEIDDDGSFGPGTLSFESKNNSIGFSPTLPVHEGFGTANYVLQSPLSEGDYWWWVSAWDGKVYGPPSEIWKFTINLVPNSPQNLIAVPGNSQITLSWAPNTEPDISRYIIYSSQQLGFTPTLGDSVGGVNHPDSSYAHVGLTNGITYYYRISAIDNLGNESEFSEEVSAIPFELKTEEIISILPNPFTPNNDGYNDYVEFKYPEMFDREPVIRIFNLKGRKVCELKEFAGNEYHWYGKDDDGRELEPGVYIYILEANGKRISSGTITLIR